MEQPGDVLSLALDLLDDNPFQPRTTMVITSLRELMASLAQTGLLQAIAVRSIGGGRYQIVAGHRRVAAFRLLLAEATTDAARSQYAKIRAHDVGDISDAQMAVAAYVENVQRAELSLVDEAAALARIREVGGHATAAQVAEATCQAERRARRLLKLFTAPAVVKEFVTEGLKVNTAAPGAPVKNEPRKLELMAALEFVRLYEHHAKQKPATADDRTAKAMTRALTHNWGFRKIQTWVDGVLNGTSPAEPITDTHPAVAARSVPPKDKGTDERSAHEPPTVVARARGTPPPFEVCSSSSERFILYLTRLKSASLDQLEAARTTIDDVRQLIEAQVKQRELKTGDAT